jgi:hypothetical protein
MILSNAITKGESCVMGGYNGWTNRETWLVNLYWGDTLTCLAADPDEWQATAQSCEDTVREFVEQSRHNEKAAFISDCVNQVLGRVNWYEIANHAR